MSSSRPPRAPRTLSPRWAIALAFFLLAACAPRARRPSGEPAAPPADPRGTVLFEQRPADPDLLAQRIERRRSEGASQEELQRLEGLLALARAFAAVDGVRARVDPERGEAVRELLRLLSAWVAQQVAAEVEPPEEPLGGVEEEPLAGPPAGPPLEEAPAETLAEQLLAASKAQDTAALARILAEMKDEDWERLDLVALWDACRALASQRRYDEAADRLAPRVEPLSHQPSRSELWVSQGQWLLAAGRYEEARAVLSRVLADYDTAADQVRRAEELLGSLQSKVGASERKMLSRLVEAEAIVEYGSDLLRAHELAEQVRLQYPGTDLSRRAAALVQTIDGRSGERIEEELPRLWERFEAGASLDEVLERLDWLAERTPGQAHQERLVRAREEFQAAEADRRLGRLRARDQEIAARWEQALAAEAEGRYEDAVELFRTLSETPRREPALEHLAAALEKLAARRRRQASELFERALLEKDARKRKLALGEVRALLEDFLDAFPHYAERERVEKDLALVQEELARTLAAINAEERPAPETGGASDGEESPGESPPSPSPSALPSPAPPAPPSPPPAGESQGGAPGGAGP